MTAITSYANALLDRLKKLTVIAKHRGMWKPGAAALAGFLLAAGAIADHAMPLPLGLVCVSPPGMLAVAAALGGCLGYMLFWGETQGVAWMAGGLLCAAIAGGKPITQRQKLLMPALASLVVSASGVGFLLWFRDNTSIPIYLLRVFLSAAVAALFRSFREDPRGEAGWMVSGVATLCLAQVVAHRELSLGYLAAGFLGVRGSFPVAAMAGLGLDLAKITTVPMAGVLALSFCVRLIPKMPKWAGWAGPGLTYLAVTAVLGRWAPQPLPGLMLGGVLGQYLPELWHARGGHRRPGVVGLAQVRLEKAAVSLNTMEHTLLLTSEPELDRRALLRQAANDSCDTCPERKGCKARHQVSGLPVELLEQPGLQISDLPPGCRKGSRLLQQLRRGQEQLRRMKGDRNRLRSYRAALQDQYGFLARFLREVSDELCAVGTHRQAQYRIDAGICSASREEVCGDRCICFETGPNRSYVLLCDGMGTGQAAAVEAEEAGTLLRQFLEAGFPPDMALRSFNSLCALRGLGGSATVDLLEADLCTGRAVIYKWGASASYLCREGQLRKIGTAGPPPGLSQQARYEEERLSLGGGEVLIMLSDGAGEEALLDHALTQLDVPAGEIAVQILARGDRRCDDATVVVVRLVPLGLGTQ